MERIRKTPLKYIYIYVLSFVGRKETRRERRYKQSGFTFLYDKEKNHNSNITYITNIYIYINIKQCRMKKH